MAFSLAASLSSFSGNASENIKNYITQFEEVATLEKWSNEKKVVILKLNLKNKALNFIMNDNNAATEKDFEVLKALLIKKFSHIDSFETIQQKFQNIMQKPGQSIVSLAEEIDEAAQKYLNFTNSKDPAIAKFNENLKLTKFLDALRADIRVEVKKLGPTNFTQAKKIAKNIENAFEDSGKDNQNSLEINALLHQNLQNKMEIAKLTEKIESLSQPTTSHNINSIKSVEENQQNHKDERVTCHICNKAHLTTKCWYFPGASNQHSQNFHRNNFHQSFRGNRQFRGRQHSHPYRGNRQRGRHYPSRDLNF